MSTDAEQVKELIEQLAMSLQPDEYISFLEDAEEIVKSKLTAAREEYGDE